ncbi:MAG: desulfoferrodoxin FeS4 iron-binding domain-containing protein [Clostridiales bacterium]|jgi:superoxide reductase|nr:desulfoferrodoxin FeS4 iron-binding domain-containing protein [Clostridiales bacterium]
MKANVKFFKCEICGNVIGLMTDGGGTLVCCGEEMPQLTANTSDGASEKHVPKVEREGDFLRVSVGETEHPADNDHYIEWISSVSENGTMRLTLAPGEKPVVTLYSPKACGNTDVYAYCNKHGLWKTEI